MVEGAGRKAKRMVLQCINGVGSNPVEGRTKKLTALKSNSNTVWFNFQTYIIFSINLVSFKVNWRSNGTYIVYGCHLLRRLYNILYFLWLYNEFFIILYNILKIAELRLLSNYNIKYICTIYTHLYTCLTSITTFVC